MIKKVSAGRKRVKPISPDEVVKKVPDAVIKAFNEEIQERWDGNKAVVLQEDVVSRIQGLMEVQRGKIFDKGWLNVESIYEDEGWSVSYEKPAYDETFKAYFSFKKEKDD